MSSLQILYNFLTFKFDIHFILNMNEKRSFYIFTWGKLGPNASKNAAKINRVWGEWTKCDRQVCRLFMFSPYVKCNDYIESTLISAVRKIGLLCRCRHFFSSEHILLFLYKSTIVYASNIAAKSVLMLLLCISRFLRVLKKQSEMSLALTWNLSLSISHCWNVVSTYFFCY